MCWFPNAWICNHVVLAACQTQYLIEPDQSIDPTHSNFLPLPLIICPSFVAIIFLYTYSTIRHVFSFLLYSIPIQGMRAPSQWHRYIMPTLQVLLAPVWLVLMLTAAQPAPLSVQSSSSPLWPILRTCPAYLKFHPFRCAYFNHMFVICISVWLFANTITMFEWRVFFNMFLHHQLEDAGTSNFANLLSRYITASTQQPLVPLDINSSPGLSTQSGSSGKRTFWETHARPH